MFSLKDAEIKLEEEMKKTLEKMRQELVTVRTGRANPAMLDTVKVETYGTLLPLNQVASIGVPEPRVIEVRPWDIHTIPDIERGILKAQLGLSPTNDGKIVRVVLPTLTEETRLDLVKHIKKIEEQYKIALRNERRIINDMVKNLEKEKKITKDELFKAEEDIQKTTDKYAKIVEEIIVHKEKEMMEV